MKRLAVSIFALIMALSAHAESATVAVATNFVTPLKELKASFERRTRHRVVMVSGSTGQLTAQVANGAPFDVLLAADQAHVRELVVAGRADSATQFTYAVGKLVLWTRDTARAPLSIEALRRDDYRWLAIANPELAPYGLAAQQVLNALGLWDELQARIVRGQSVAQTFAMAATGNAELALVALSEALAYRGSGSYVEVPANLYAPIRQDAVLLSHGAENQAAREFLIYLQDAATQRVLAEFGYGSEAILR